MYGEVKIKLTEKISKGNQMQPASSYVSAFASSNNEMDVSTKSDLYQVGVVLYSICTVETDAEFDEFKRIPQKYSDELDKVVRLLLGSKDGGNEYTAKKIVDVLKDLATVRASAKRAAKQDR